MTILEGVSTQGPRDVIASAIASLPFARSSYSSFPMGAAASDARASVRLHMDVGEVLISARRGDDGLTTVRGSASRAPERVARFLMGVCDVRPVQSTNNRYRHLRTRGAAVMPLRAAAQALEGAAPAIAACEVAIPIAGVREKVPAGAER